MNGGVESKIVRCGGQDYALIPLLTTDQVVVMLRLAKLQTGMLEAAARRPQRLIPVGDDPAANAAAESEAGIAMTAVVAASVVNGLTSGDLREGGDLWPLIQSIRLQTPGGPFDITSQFDLHWQRRLPDLLFLMQEAVKYNFAGFPQGFANAIVSAFRATVDDVKPEASSPAA